MLWSWSNSSVVCVYYAVQTSYWSMADVTFSTVDDTLCKNLPHHSLITIMRRVIEATPTLQHPSLSLYCKVTSCPDRLIDWMIDWMLCNIHCLCVFVNITKHCMRHILECLIYINFFLLLLLFNGLIFHCSSTALRILTPLHQFASFLLCIVWAPYSHILYTAMIYFSITIIFSHYYHHHYRHHCFALVCESACACVWDAHLERKLITISLYQKWKKGKWKSTQTIFYNNFDITYHDLFFWYATFFEYL